MNREKLMARLAVLDSDRQKIESAINQNSALLQATNGAIQDCQYWLKELDAAEAPVSLPKTLELVPQPEAAVGG